MMECTDKHFRYLLRLVSKHTVLYTEMITTGAILNGDRERLLNFNAIEHPVALQLGGSDPSAMARCARLGAEAGYDEINLNIGCPSDRVQSGRFGACLMAEPELVADCVAHMRCAVNLPVTVKTRIGIDNNDSYEALCRFIAVVSEAGCEVFIIHARKAWLKGLSPKQNREVPPLKYDIAYRLKQDFPEIEIILNGGLTSLREAQQHLYHVDGVMVGREVYSNPYALSEVDHLFYSDDSHPPSRREVLDRYLPYVENQLKEGVSLSGITRHLMGLFQGLPGARAWRRALSEKARRPGAGVAVLQQAARCVIESNLARAS